MACAVSRAMAEAWLDFLVSVDCGSSLGVYMGRIFSVDQKMQTISLSQPYRNGVRCTVGELTLSANDIKDLKILEMPQGQMKSQARAREEVSSQMQSQSRVQSQMPSQRNGISQCCEEFNCITGRRGSGPGDSGGPVMQMLHMKGGEGDRQTTPQPISKRYGERSVQRGSCSPQQKEQGCHAQSATTDASTDKCLGALNKAIRRRHNSWSSTTRFPGAGTPSKAGNRRVCRGRDKTDDCFADDLDNLLATEFDFEGNLALFDKAAVFQEIASHEKCNGVARRVKYRHDENILEPQPAVFRQISVPEQSKMEYCTDTGLVVPAVTPELHQQLLAAAERGGLTLERRMEVVGICASQMALMLLGGSSRLDPKNSHQRPSVVVLCGVHEQGAQGIACARHLANHGVSVLVYLHNCTKSPPVIAAELRLLQGTTATCMSQHAGLPTGPVDLLVNCLDCTKTCTAQREQPWYRSVVAWAGGSRAPVLTIDPPASGPATPGGLQSKWSLALGLPLALGEGAGRVYLCDLGIPESIFQEVGILYHPPFG
uniref:Enhancer of mRNA-decapping protein 3 n=2 Tax=Eptatretus burgeri TaxID=7764 RepID=A0A8C4N9M8_EPTBU